MLKQHLQRLETSEDETGMTSGRTGEETRPKNFTIRIWKRVE